MSNLIESIVMCLFILLLLVHQIKEQQQIILYSNMSIMRRILAVGLGITILYVFWQNDTPDLIKLVGLVVLLIFSIFSKEGLGKDGFVKFGIFSGDYKKYKTIEIEEFSENKTLVIFNQSKNQRHTIFFDIPVKEVIEFLSDKNLDIHLNTAE
ncbi:hypothetical protein [Aerococcus agrisoli]|jgi:hypothetical protein|nr:hypothetical protein [Aerococcus agrisoli]